MLNCRGQKVPLSKNSLLFKGKDHVPIFSWLNPLNLLIISQQNVMFCGWMGMAWQVTITTGEVGIYNNEQVIDLEGVACTSRNSCINGAIPTLVLWHKLI